MPGVEESIGVKSQLAAGLEAGVETLSLNQVVTFVRYIKLVLPFDGTVFWVRSDLVGPSALLNTATFNAAYFNQPPRPLTERSQFEARGSMHYATDTFQLEDESFAKNTMTFTSQNPIDDLNEVSPQVMYIGEFDGLRFVFSQRGKFYRQADLYHYRGDAVYPALATQIIDDAALLDTANIVVSNSLPAWLQLSRYFPIYPSFLVPDNLEPPYGVVHIAEDGTRALQAVPLIDSRGAHYQLAADKVRFTLYGLRNFNALDWLDYVLRYSTDTDVLGLMNMPIVRDAKKSQNELGIIAQKKTIEFEVSYYQTRIRDVGRQFILSCVPTITVSDTPRGGL
jgi:hypothetical protein